MTANQRSDQPQGYAHIDETATDPAQAWLVRWLDVQNSWPALQAINQRVAALLQIRAGNTVLDAGCGTGDDARTLSELAGAGGRVIGIDASQAMIDEARRRNGDRFPSVEFQLGDIHQLVIPDDTFDSVRSVRTFQWLTDPSQALGELIRLTRPGGRIVVADTDWPTLIWGVGDPQLAAAIAGYWTTRIPNPRSGRELPSRFERAGLRDLVVEPHLFANDHRDASPEFAEALRAVASAAREAGVITPRDAEQWSAALDDAASNGSFFAAAIVFIVAGTKPAATAA